MFLTCILHPMIPPLFNSAKIHVKGARGRLIKGCRDLTSPTRPLKRVNRILIFCSCLSVMTSLTQRLPVVFIPEQALVTSVWFDMVNHRSLSELSFLLTAFAKRMGVQESFARFPPTVIITTFTCISSIIYMKLRMKLTVLIIGQQRTAVVFAWLLWFLWHCSQLHTQLKKPRRFVLQGLLYDTSIAYTLSQGEGGLTWLFMACLFLQTKTLKGL